MPWNLSGWRKPVSSGYWLRRLSARVIALAAGLFYSGFVAIRRGAGHAWWEQRAISAHLCE